MSAQLDATAKNERSKALRYTGIGALWIVSALLAVLFLITGAGKFDTFWVDRFIGYGYPAAFTYLVGVAEIVGGLMLLVPRAAFYGAGLLALIMLGATATHLVNGEMNWSFTLILTALLVAIGVSRRRLTR